MTDDEKRRFVAELSQIRANTTYLKRFSGNPFHRISRQAHLSLVVMVLVFTKPDSGFAKTTQEAQIVHLSASADKIQLEKALHPMVVGAGLFAGMAGVIIGFVRGLV